MLLLIKLSCPCGRQIQVKHEHAGQETQCPVCGQIVCVPAMGLPARAEEPPPVIAPSPARNSSRPWRAGVAALAVVAAIGLLWSFLQRPAQDVPAGPGSGRAWVTLPPAPPRPPDDGGLPPLPVQPAPAAMHAIELRIALDQGQRAIRLDDLEKATEALAKASRIAPEDSGVVQALKELEEARLDRTNRATLEQMRAERAQNALRAHDVARQLEKLRAEKAQREREAALLEAQLKKLRAGLPADAVKTAREKAQRAESQASFRQLLESGKALLAAGKFDRAVEELTLAVARLPENAEANQALRDARAGQVKMRAEVKEHLEQVRLALVSDNLPEAARALHAAVRLAPEDPEVLRHHYLLKTREEVQPLVVGLLEKGRDAIDDGRFDEAAGAFVKVLRLVPESPGYRKLLDAAKEAASKQAEARLRREQADEVARIRAGRPDQMLALREHTDRARATLREQLAALQVQNERMAVAFQAQMHALRQHSDRVTVIWREQMAGMREETERMAGAGRGQMAGIYEQTGRMQGASRLQLAGIHEQTDRMQGAAGAQLAGIHEQGERMAGAGRMQMEGIREQGDRMAGASRQHFQVIQEQGERMAGAGRLQMGGLIEQTDRMQGAAGVQLAGLREQGDRLTAFNVIQMAGMQEQGERMAGAGRLQRDNLREQGDRMIGAGRLQTADLVEQTDRMRGAAGGQLRQLQEQDDRMSGAGRVQREALRDQTDRMTGAAGLQMAGLGEQTDRMATVARQPVGFQVRRDLAVLAAQTPADVALKPLDPAAAEAHAERQRRLREAQELERLRAERMRQERDEAELKSLLEDSDRLARARAEMSLLRLERERQDALNSAVTNPEKKDK